MPTPDATAPQSWPPQGRKAVGHPVDVGSGAQFCAWHDVEIGGVAPLVFRRYYSTSLVTHPPGRCGLGWTHNFALELSRMESGYRLRDQNGGVIDFREAEEAPRDRLLNEAASMDLRVQGEIVRIYHWHDWKTAVETLWFRRSAAGDFVLARIAPPSGFGLALDYDAAGKLSSVTQMVEGRRLSFSYDRSGFVRKLLVSSPASRPRSVASYAYDAQGRLEEVRDASGAPIRYAYDRAGRLTREENRSGAVFLMRYDRGGRCIETRGTDGYHARRLQYLPGGRLTVVTDSLEHQTVYALNAEGQVLTETRPNGAVFSTTYDEFGRITTEEDPLGRSTRYRYDGSGNTAGIVYPNGLTDEIDYDEDHQPTRLQRGRSTWRFSYAAGHLTAVIDPLGVERRYTYDTRGWLRSMTEPSGNTVEIHPDDAWSSVRVSDDYGLDREEHYDDLMEITRIVEPDGSVYRFDFDSLGRIVGAAAPGSSPREYGYDAGGYLVSATNADGHTVRLRHSAHGLLEEIVTPTGRRYECTWDTEGRLKTWVNPAGERAEIEHDAVGNEILVRHFDGRVEAREFDLAGRAIRRRLADGTEIGFEYDVSDNVVRVHSAGIDLIVNAYDDEGRLSTTRTPGTEVSLEYDVGSTIVAEVQNGRRIEFTYDRIGALASRTFTNSPLPPLEFRWDKRLRLMSFGRGAVPLQTFSYDVMDRCIERRVGECVEKLEYGPSGTVVGQEVVRAGRTLVSRYWTRDRRGNVVAVDDQLSGRKNYEFDADERLVKSTAQGGDVHYTYDSAGNLARVDGGPRSRSLEYLSGNRLTRVGGVSYERDPNGKVVRIGEGNAATSLSWNALGQLVEMLGADGSVTRFTYDGFGRRLLADTASTRTEYVWSGQQLLAEVSGDVTTEYLFAEFNPIAYWRGTELRHLVCSHLGVPHEALTERGVLAWSLRLGDWGDLERFTGTDEPVPFRFPGQYADDRLYYNRFRYYDPDGCQYLSPDPQGLGAGVNEYAYCPNPINWVDLFGLSCGIPPGQHSVYVLEKGPPPAPPTVIYVGITRQSPHDRLAQHKATPPGGVTPDSMRIIATGPPQVPDRTAARLIEASILTNAPQPGQPGALNNAVRPVNPGYYHSNVPSASPPGTTYLPATTTNGLLAPTNGTRIT